MLWDDPTGCLYDPDEYGGLEDDEYYDDERYYGDDWDEFDDIDNWE